MTIAQSFLEKYLPSDLSCKMDFSQLSLEHENYVNERLKSGIVDILFSVPMNGDATYIYILVEHQSSPDQWMPLRIRQYICMILDEIIATSNPEKLPLIYPMVFYNGRDPYNKTLDFLELFDAPKELADRCMNRPLHLIDLSSYDDEQIKGGNRLTVFLMLMKHIYDADILKVLLDLVPYLSQIEKEINGVEFLTRVMHYILNSCETGDVKEVLKTTIATLSQETGGEIVTLAEQLIEMGRQEKESELMKLIMEMKEERQKAEQDWRQKAAAERQKAAAERQKATREFALNLLRHNCAPDFISSNTGLSLEAIAELQKEIAQKD